MIKRFQALQELQGNALFTKNGNAFKWLQKYPSKKMIFWNCLKTLKIDRFFTISWMQVLRLCKKILEGVHSRILKGMRFSEKTETPSIVSIKKDDILALLENV